MNKHECNIDRELTDATAQAPADASCSLIKWREMTSWLLSWNCDIKSKIRLRHYLREEHSCQISSRSDLKRRSLRFEDGRGAVPGKNLRKKQAGIISTVDTISHADGYNYTRILDVIWLKQTPRQKQVVDQAPMVLIHLRTDNYNTWSTNLRRNAFP